MKFYAALIFIDGQCNHPAKVVALKIVGTVEGLAENQNPKAPAAGPQMDF
jgi:hypothetical protein